MPPTTFIFCKGYKCKVQNDYVLDIGCSSRPPMVFSTQINILYLHKYL